MSPLLAAPILLTLTLLVSGIAKLPERRGTVDAMTSLRLPLRSLHPLAAVAVPLAELAAAVALWIPWVPLQVTAALAVALLMAAYLVIIARALTFPEAVHCSCFGTLASPTVSRATLYRNLTLTALGVLGVVAAASGAVARAEAEAPLALMGWALALATAVALTSFALGGVSGGPSAGTGAGPGTGTGAGAGTGTGDDDDLEDYARRPIPYAVLERADGSTMLLRELAPQGAALVLVLSPGCGPCMRVLPQVRGWAERLAGVVAVRTVFTLQLDQVDEATLEQAGEEPTFDLDGNLQRALGMLGAPSATLLGADGLLAGGPVIGSSDVEEFVADVIAQIEEARADGELPPPAGADPDPRADDDDPRGDVPDPRGNVSDPRAEVSGS